ncbi:MAG: alkaline phosphatase [Bacillota bacterium]|uniref:alkaline phosphatase n=1 Tax=Desulforudis sp. DRI-14 TaxID=3459793 RepID=UPI003498F4FF
MPINRFLIKNKKGFFLFIEGSKVDWASHANDPIGVISDVLAFDRAVKTAVDFAKKDGHTLVIAFSDHGNGGMSIGSMESNKNYDTLKPSQVVDPLKKAKLTGEGLEAKLNADRSNIAEVMAAYYGITDLTEQEIQAIKEAKPGSLNYAVGPMISKRSMIGWATNGHCGEDIFLYAYGPQKPAGLLDNTQIKHIGAAMGLDLAKTSKTLFTPAEAFKTLSAEVTVDKSDPENPVIKGQKGHTTMTLKTSTDIAVFNGKTYILNGPSLLITVKNKAGEITHERAYVPQQAVDLFVGQVKKAA